eukprot:40331-Chlamydomonas_euryale.AAC.1
MLRHVGRAAAARAHAPWVRMVLPLDAWRHWTALELTLSVSPVGAWDAREPNNDDRLRMMR